MKLLALEFSTDRAGIAAADGARVLAAETLETGRRRCMELFPAAERVLAAAGWTFGEVERYAVGIGPGSYTGLRVSLTAARGWALPGNTPVHAIPSPAALAAEALAADPSRPVAVCGDARRGHLWCALFEADPRTLVRQVEPFALVPAGERGAKWPAARWLEPDSPPSAAWLAALSAADYPQAPLEPIYLHPPVAAPPAP
jgi:tRNA threonylcarbamoyladenosine biosynthesis protein TsaB